jgi:hypothetical protein
MLKKFMLDSKEKNVSRMYPQEDFLFTFYMETPEGNEFAG